MPRSVSDIELLDAFRRLLRAVRNQVRPRYHISEAQYWVLQGIADAGRPLSVTEIAQQTQTDVSAATRKCASLHDMDLLARAGVERDRRKTVQQLTPKGERLLKEIRQGTDARLLEILNRVPREERRTLLGLLDKLATDQPRRRVND